MALSETERRYLASQRLGRLADVSSKGEAQNNPVGLHYNPELGTVDIYGLQMGSTKQFANVKGNPAVALAVDGIVSVDPWQVRGLEIRGEPKPSPVRIPLGTT